MATRHLLVLTIGLGLAGAMLAAGGLAWGGPSSPPGGGGGGGGGSGCVPAGSAGQVLSDDGAGACSSTTALISGGALTLGSAGSAAGTLKLSGGTSGTLTLAGPAAASGTLKFSGATDALQERVDAIARTPLPPQTAARGFAGVTKCEDGAGGFAADDDIVAALARMSEEERTLALIKAAHATPITRVARTAGGAAR